MIETEFEEIIYHRVYVVSSKRASWSFPTLDEALEGMKTELEAGIQKDSIGLADTIDSLTIEVKERRAWHQPHEA